MVLQYKWDAVRALQAIQDEKVNNIVGVPTNTYDLATGLSWILATCFRFLRSTICR